MKFLLSTLFLISGATLFAGTFRPAAEAKLPTLQRITTGTTDHAALLEFSNDQLVYLKAQPEGLATQMLGGYNLGSAAFANHGNSIFWAYRWAEEAFRIELDTQPFRPSRFDLRVEGVSGNTGSHHLGVSPDGRYMALLTEYRLRFFDTQEKRVMADLELTPYYNLLSKSAPGLIAFSPDSRYAVLSFHGKGEASIDRGYRAKLGCFDLEKNAWLWLIDPENVHPYGRGKAYYVAFSANGERVYTFEGDQPASDGGTASVIDYYERDAATGSIIRTKKLRYNIPGPVFAFSADRKFAAYAGKDFITVFDTHTLETVSETWPGDDLPIRELEQIAFFGEKRWIIGFAKNRPELFLFDTEKDEQAARIWFFGRGDQWAAVSYNGTLQGTQGGLANLRYVAEDQEVPIDSRFAARIDNRLFGHLMETDQPLRPPPPVSLDVPSVSLALAGSESRGLSVEDDVETHAFENETAGLVVTTTTRAHPVAEVRLYHNGKLVQNRTRGLVVEDDPEINDETTAFEVALLPGENTFRALAIDTTGAESTPAELILRRPLDAENPGGLRAHLLVVGINEYSNARYNLNYAVADAEAFIEAYEASAKAIFGGGIETVRIFNEDATRANVEAAFKQMQQTASPRDVFVFYYAGHGVMAEDQSEEFFLVPTEVTQLYATASELRSKAISARELREWSRLIPAQKQLFLLDACQSARALDAVAVRGAAQEKAIAQLARSTGTHWLAASGSSQFASEVEELGHGVFTYALIQALKGAADSGDGRVTVNELKSYLEAQVPELTQTYKGIPQYPASFGSGQDFPLGLSAREEPVAPKR
jgi:hypothetical protein